MSGAVKNEAEKIAVKARKSISSFCYEECRSYCCRKGYLIINGFEADLLTDRMADEFESRGMLKKLENGNYSLFLGSNDGPCPQLNEFKCSIHMNPKRPRACRDFPVFVDHENKTVRLSHRCLAVKQGMFYAFVKQWMAIDYRVTESDPFYDADRYDSFSR
ncbi:hypothetical protein GF345_04425 [Candidatus Woesearchaeota archaeon]|nr:hypothetical protein [Candidatus Woesearchaeota archaeon]